MESTVRLFEAARHAKSLWMGLRIIDTNMKILPTPANYWGFSGGACGTDGAHLRLGSRGPGKTQARGRADPLAGVGTVSSST